ncbi:MAG: sulfotransferase domain-containing protein [Lachnospiraceae bacterium]|nr:sulfotransferase domain-containing protein [Lachnospiraceae bacterium]
MLVGFAKCGTTSIQKILEHHPDIYLPKQKETQFMYLDFEYKKGIEYYKKKYYDIPVGKYKAIGGIEPSWAGSAKRVSRYFDRNTKIIFIMRNPVDFTYSLYRMMAYLGVVSPDNVRPFRLDVCFDTELNKKRMDRKLDLWDKDFNGFYIKSIKDYLKYFPRENMLFIFLEDFIANEKKVCNDICDFLEIAQLRFIPPGARHSNENDRFLKSYMLGILNRYFRNATFWLKEKDICDLEYSNIVGKIHNKITVIDKSKMSIKARTCLEALYYRSVRELEEIISMPLGKIWF